MSLVAFAVSLALAGQLAADDRYGAPSVSPPPSDRNFDYGNPPASTPSAGAPQAASPPGTSPQGTVPNPFAAGNRGVSAPPPKLPEERAAPVAPSVSGRDYGLRDFSPPSSLPAGRSAPNGLTPTAMMRAMLTPPPGARLTGQKVSLAEVVAGTSSRAAQSQRIDAYWDLCSSVADYYLGLREQDELQRLRSMVPSVSPAWHQAETELGVRIGTSQRAAVAAQYRLASLMGRGEGSLPLPGDVPHCGDYFVRYDQIFAGRSSPEAQQLSELLPLRYEELRDASTAVTRAEEWLGTTASQRSGDGTNVLRSLELLALRRRAFVQIVRDYNRRIVRYTELASPGDIGSDRLIGMLIKRDNVPNTATRPPYDRQSQFEATNGQETPRTFDEDWSPVGTPPATTRRDDAVEPASANKPRTSEPRRERSLLVKPAR